MKKNSVIKKNILKQKIAIEMLAFHPEMTNKQLSRELKLDIKTVSKWRGNKKFINASYDRYMEVTGNQLPLVLQALIREAIMGNTKAIELVLKHWGKLQDTLVVKVESPFMQHLKEAKVDNFDDAQIVDVIEDLGPEQLLGSFEMDTDLPERSPINDMPNIRNKVDNERVKKIQSLKGKNQKKLDQEKYKRKKMNRKAKLMGMEHLPAGRPTKQERDAWVRKFKKLEKEFDVKS